MQREFANLRVCHLNEERQKLIGYKFTVTEGATSHTAFRYRSSLLRWLDQRGLDLTEDLEEGECQKIVGKYKSHMHLSYADFYQHFDSAHHTKLLSNGKWTLGLITTDDDGIKTVHHLNPNCIYRPTFNYQECREAHG